MYLILGGAYQGKRTFARTTYSLLDSEIFTCASESDIDFSYPCITHLEAFTYGCTLQGKDPVAYFIAHQTEWQHCILICRDIFCGIVPLDATDRTWREATGRLCQYLAAEADNVSRIFCGLEQRLK